MDKKVLLIQPPYGRILEIPFGTLPALTSALRSKGYPVIQRDFNVDMFLLCLESDIAEMVLTNAQEKLRIISGCTGKKMLDDKKELGIISGEFKKKMPMFPYVKDAIKVETERGKFSLKTHNKANMIYRLYCELIRLSATPMERLWDYQMRINDEYNMYYVLFDKLLASLPMDEINLLGITISGKTKIAGLTLGALVRERYPHIYITLGGALFNAIDFDDEEDLKDIKNIIGQYSHGIVVNEGERAIVSIYESLCGSYEWGNVKNLVTIKDDKVNVNKPFYIEKKEDLNGFDFDGLPVEYYPGLPMEISRGCYWAKCSFCERYKMHKRRDEYSHETPYYRCIDSDKIIDDLRNIKTKYNKAFIEFVCICIAPVEMERLCNAIIASGINIKFGARMRFEKGVTPELIELMARAGAFYITLSPETISGRMAKIHNKGYDVNHILNIIEYWRKNRKRLPPLVLNFITMYPGETYRECIKLYKFIKKGKFAIGGIAPFWLSKHSGVYYNPEKYGLRITRKRNRLFFNVQLEWDTEVAIEREKMARFIKRNKKKLKSFKSEWQVKSEVVYAP